MKTINKKLLSVLLVAVILLSSTNIIFAAKWYDEAVNFGKQKGLVAEDINVLREIDYSYVLQSLNRFNGGVGLADEDLLNWALEKDLIKETTKLDSKITRSELSYVISKYVESIGINAVNLDSKISSAPDYKDIPEEHNGAMMSTYSLGLITGDVNKNIRPNDNTIQVEFLTILMRLDELIANRSSITGKIEDVSKYGNVTTDISLDAFKAKGFEAGDLIKVKVGEETLIMPFGDTYSNVDNKKEVIVPSKDGKIVVAINMGNFSETYKAVVGTEMTFSMEEKAGYFEEYEIRSIDKYRTNNREDYKSDEVFANFRPIEMGKIGKNILFRSSSPINPALGRAAYADKLVKENKIKTVVNFADSKEELEGYFTADTFDSPYYKSLYDDGKVIYLDMGVDFSSEDFQSKMKDALIFMGKNEGPFLIHCNEGKDRAGFGSLLLEALMGGSVDEIREDYMKSYINFFFVEKDSKQYDKIADSNIMKSLMMITNTESEEELKKVNLQEKTEIYLEEVIGLNKEQIKSLKEVLSKDLAYDFELELVA